MDGESELKFYKSIGASWLAYSDGGGRGDGWSAFAWIMYAVICNAGQKSQRFIVAYGFEAVEGDHSSFCTELWGLERAATIMDEITR